MIDIKNLSGGYQQKMIIHDLSLTIETSHFYAIIGPNGSGKTTLIKLLTGVLPSQKGTISIFNQSLRDLSTQARAKMMAVLSQEVQIDFDFLVEEIVLLGRYPHQKGIIKHISKRDYQIVEEVMKQTNVLQFRKQPFNKLSGGEKQRVLLAKALAQEPKILFLDEPTNHLDIKHTVEMLLQIKDYQRKHQLTIVAILHDLNTAALFADKVVLMNEGKIIESSDLSVLQKEDQLQEVYEVAIKNIQHPVVPKPQITVVPYQVATMLNNEMNFEIKQTEHFIHIGFNHPLRTISNSVLGDGLTWCNHFCNFHVDKDYHSSDPKKDIINWLEVVKISEHNTVGMMTAAILQDRSIVHEEKEGVEILVVTTAGVGNAVDITDHSRITTSFQIGTVNIMVFLNAHLTDGALVNAIQSATEAKTKAFHDLQIKDPHSQTVATGTSTDSTLIATTQLGELTPYAGSGTVIGKAIGITVYKTIIEAVTNNKIRCEKQ